MFIVFNPGSGHGDAGATRNTIEAAAAAAGRSVQMLVVDDARRIAGIAGDAVRRAREANGVVVAAGGDGTINAVAQATLGSGCAFGVLPQGTFNYFSRAHGIPADTAEAMQVLLHQAARPEQVGLINDQVFLVNASLGLYPKLLEDRETWKNQFGRSRVVAFGAGLATLLSGHRALRLLIDVHGETRAVRTPTLFVGNNALQLAQLGVPQADAVAAGAGELAGITLRPVGRLAMVWLLLHGALGRLGDAENVLSFAFEQLTVRRPRGLAARRIKVATDGEVRWMQLPLVFRVSPEPLLLIRPAIAAQAGASAEGQRSA